MDTYEPYDPELKQFLETFPFDAFAPVGELANPPGRLRPVDGEEQSAASRHDQILVDGYGCRFQFKGVGLPYCLHHPLAGAETVGDVEAFPWPEPDASAPEASQVIARARTIHAAGEHMTVVGIPHIFHQYHYLRGFEQWMVDIKLNRAVHEAIARHIRDINLALVMQRLDQVGPYTDLVTMGDDFGTSTSSYMSPSDFQTLIKPHYCHLISNIKSRFPHIKFYLHSHGQITDLIPDLIECGVDVLNPILPLDNIEPVHLKREFGRDLCFHGGIDIERIVPFGTQDEVRDHVKRVIDILAPGGGYWLKLQAISPVCPPENVITAYETAAEYGCYPM
jgi:uroporphyrinogen decarboxylase